MLAILVALTAALTNPTISDNRVPDARLVSRVEAQVIMPDGAGPLNSYDRSYTQAKIDGKDYLLGQMIDHTIVQEFASHGHPLPPPVRRVLIDEIMPAFDGGCAILTLTYEIGSAEKPKLFCNPDGPH